ncbi:MAG: hydrogenase maturation nickel metallochaperone HypA [Faecalicoccus sp.]|nr:hydrogenase maturation nickel metallochaperone HypA [Faecalicoccus sp.]
MHELGIALHVMDTVEELAKENELEHVYSVTLEIGEVSGVIFDYLADVWDWAANKRELFQGSKLLCETIPAITYCRNCHKTYETVTYGRTCPYCQSPETELAQGDELNIKEIEAL